MPESAVSAPARNLELKVACTGADLAEVRTRLATLGVAIVERLRQVDTYLRAANGRLKLRTIVPIGEDGADAAGARAELIGYERADRTGSRWSSYHVVAIPPAEADPLRSTLAATIGILVQVEKRRDIAILGATRIHLDQVMGLGTFIELETVIAGQADAEAEREHQHVITTLGLDRWAAVPGSYSDLLLAKQAGDRNAGS
ncbi:MAG: class IV adenylate cyclase [Thermomicrobiales bacterium]